jgi:hypothetical protein
MIVIEAEAPLRSSGGLDHVLEAIWKSSWDPLAAAL